MPFHYTLSCQLDSFIWSAHTPTQTLTNTRREGMLYRNMLIESFYILILIMFPLDRFVSFLSSMI